MVMPKVVYANDFKGENNFFKNIKAIKDFIEENKDYKKLWR